MSVSVPDGRVVREDGWLRIWLERPWFASGAGELLGVVLLDRTPTGPVDPMYDYVSLAGRDAAHGTVFINGVRPDDVVNPVAVERGVILPECLVRLGGQAERVSVALFVPEFDFVSQRWYADVRISLFGYFPMVRLAVVHYQPTSVANDDPVLSGHHYFVSPGVLLDPIPLFPDRRLTVKKVIKPTHVLLQLELSGTTYTSVMTLTGEPSSKAPALSRVTARPQSRFPVDLAGGGEHWLNGPEIRFKRDDPSKAWRCIWRTISSANSVPTWSASLWSRRTMCPPIRPCRATRSSRHAPSSPQSSRGHSSKIVFHWDQKTYGNRQPMASTKRPHPAGAVASIPVSATPGDGRVTSDGVG
jgi:hypothetical protein